MRMGLIVLFLVSLLCSTGCKKSESESPAKKTSAPVVQDMEIQKPVDK